MITYQSVENHFSSKDHSRKCINGKYTGCNNCVGYCSYYEHKGYLTKELRKQHDCLNKGCYYYIEKAKTDNAVNNIFAQIETQNKYNQEEILDYANKAIFDYEGMKFLKVLTKDFSSYVLTYVTISNDYPFDIIEKDISSSVGCTVVLERLNYSFENIVALLLKS